MKVRGACYANKFYRNNFLYNSFDISYNSKLNDNEFVVLNESPKGGADNKLINFVHPKSTHGVLVEICQDKE